MEANAISRKLLTACVIRNRLPRPQGGDSYNSLGAEGEGGLVPTPYRGQRDVSRHSGRLRFYEARKID